LYGPRWTNINGALLKNFSIRKLGEQGKLQFKIETNNLLNHPNFGLPNAAIGTATGPGGVGTISSASTGRTMQLGASLTF
jgi:hypothetical protein